MFGQERHALQRLAKSEQLTNMFSCFDLQVFFSDVGHLPLAPYAAGSHRSRLVEILDADHYGVKLSPADRRAIVPYSAVQAHRGPISPAHSPSAPVAPARSRILRTQRQEFRQDC